MDTVWKAVKFELLNLLELSGMGDAIKLEIMEKNKVTSFKFQLYTSQRLRASNSPTLLWMPLHDRVR